jgi:hypothetical protein
MQLFPFYCTVLLHILLYIDLEDCFHVSKLVNYYKLELILLCYFSILGQEVAVGLGLNIRDDIHA